MHRFDYVSKDEYLPVKNELIEIIHSVQNAVRQYFTFDYRFIGSSARNMITKDYASNTGYDFDINVEVNDPNQEYSPKEIKHILMNAFNRFIPLYGYNHCEDSTSVFTFKFVDRAHSAIIHGCDIAIVHNYIDYGKQRQQYIRFNKEKNEYTWENRKQGYGIDEKVYWLKKKGYWTAVRDYYLDKKNINEDPDMHSRTIFAITINECCMKFGYSYNR